MNKDNYKKAINQIHPSEELKQKTLQKMLENKKRKRMVYYKYIAACAMILIACIAGNNYLYKPVENLGEPIATETVIEKNDLPRFKSMQELKDVLKENDAYREKNGIIFDSAQESVKSDSASIMEESKSIQNNFSSTKDYSTTNVQVENVDEADIVKTDGNYIYYVKDNKVIIIKADNLEVISIIDESKFEEKDKRFLIQEIFINENYLVALGNEMQYQKIKTQTVSIGEGVQDLAQDIIVDTGRVRSLQTAKVKVYNISDRKNPVLEREVALSGYYSNSRMIGDYVYFISRQNAYYTSLMNDEEILPFYKDSAKTDEKVSINYTDIAYLEGTNNYNYTLIAGFNIKNKEEINLETFLGASDTVYASQKNLYIAQVTYRSFYYRAEKSTIYKFNMDNGKIILQCKGEVDGDLNNQFSMDEYDGNLRIATTSYNEENESTNQLYILDNNLKEIARIEDLAKGEKIYAVRFIGKIGYIVTFKEIDPLFVIDLSDPTAPVVKGELKIPGYSSYLHPYDETHIIGIGYNTKSNGYGSVTNSNMKMSMFDVSDLENPKEMFSIDIGGDYAYSEITSNHKALFYNKDRNLIGFPVTFRAYRSNGSTNNFVLYKIDLENGFQEYGHIQQKINYKTNINRAIYIGNTLYTLSNSQMISYNLDTMEKLDELVYPEENENYFIEE